MILEYTKDAEADIDAIWLYSRQTWGPVVAAEYLERLADCAEALARGELSGTSETALRKGLRRQVVESHIIWFRIDGEVLRVIRVLHASRDAGRWVR